MFSRWVAESSFWLTFTNIHNKFCPLSAHSKPSSKLNWDFLTGLTILYWNFDHKLVFWIVIKGSFIGAKEMMPNSIYHGKILEVTGMISSTISSLLQKVSNNFLRMKNMSLFPSSISYSFQVHELEGLGKVYKARPLCLYWVWKLQIPKQNLERWASTTLFIVSFSFTTHLNAHSSSHH